MRTPSPHLRAALAVFTTCCITAALVTSPATAQVDEGELAALQRALDDLTPQVEDLTGLLTDTNTEIADIDLSLRRADTEQALLVDDYTRALDGRTRPADFSRAAAIASFVYGDPRAESALQELAALDFNRENSQRRQVYDTVITDALESVAAADQQLRRLADQVNASAAAYDEAVRTRSQLIDIRSTLLEDRAALLQQQRALRLRIDWLSSLQSRWVLTGAAGWDGTERRVLAVKIDNVAAARPQSGINEADIVFEERVEDGRTRLIAVFHSTPADPVGPIRSVRTSDPKILENLASPLLASSGGNAGARRFLADSALTDVGVLAFPDLYWRNRGRRAPHNLYANSTDLWTAGGAGVGPPPSFRFRPPGEPLPAGSTPVRDVHITFGKTDVSYSWTGSGWARSQDGTPHVDTAGIQVAPTNVVVQFIGYSPSPADLASPEANVVGTGDAWVLLDGHLIEAQWVRSTPGSPTLLFDTAGEVLPINAGRTWVELPQIGSAATYQ